MSRFSIRIRGGQAVADELGATLDQIDRAKKSALTRITGQVKRKLTAQIVAGTGLAEPEVKSRIRVYNPNNRFENARVIPSSAGVPANLYELTAIPGQKFVTRGRFSVPWFGGQKVGAGFVNVMGKQRTPLRTRSSKGKYVYSTGRPTLAMGPSIAFAAKRLINAQMVAEYETKLAALFEKLLTQRVAKDDESN